MEAAPVSQVEDADIRPKARCESVSDSETDANSDALSSQASSISVGDSQDYPAMVWDTETANKGISTMAATLSLITACVGAGIMALPQLPKSAGLVPTVFLTILCALAVLESIMCYFKAWAVWNATHKREERLVTFEDFGGAAFGRPGALAVRVIQIGWFMGACAGYIILIVSQLRTLMAGVWDLSYVATVGIVCMVLMCLAMLRDVSALAKLMPVGACAAFATALLIVIQAAQDAQVWDRWPEEEQLKVHTLGLQHGVAPLGSALATLYGAFGVAGNVPPVLAEMRKKKRLPVALSSAIFVTAVLYLVVVVIGYYAYGNFIQPDIVASMTQSPANAEQAFTLPFKMWTGHRNRVLPHILSWTVLANLVISYPLLMMCVFVSIQGTACAQPRLKAGQPLNYALRIGCVCLTGIVAATVDRFDILFALFSSVLGPLQSTIIPIIFGARIRAACGARRSGPVRRIYHGFLLALSVFCMIDGFVDSMKNLLHALKDPA